MKLYIAYGSNLNLEQMKYRCPEAKTLYKGIVKGYTLVYRGSKTGAYATIIPNAQDFVPVVVWGINSVHEHTLDIYEGYPHFYYKKELTVILENHCQIKGIAYIMFDEAKVGRPSKTYLDICRQGYKDNGLDMEKFENSINNNLRELYLND